MKPILFNTDMTRAILEGRKNTTRRIACKANDLREFHSKTCPDGVWFRGRVYKRWKDAMESPQGILMHCRYKTGNILWVRETWAEMPYGIVYRADDEEPEGWDADDRWRPSIHMPRKAARIFLKVTGVWVDQLQDITSSDVQAEGFNNRKQFIEGWNKIVSPKDIPAYNWNANPWVFVIGFKRISKEEAEDSQRRTAQGGQTGQKEGPQP